MTLPHRHPGTAQGYRHCGVPGALTRPALRHLHRGRPTLRGSEQREAEGTRDGPATRDRTGGCLLVHRINTCSLRTAVMKHSAIFFQHRSDSAQC